MTQLRWMALAGTVAAWASLAPAAESHLKVGDPAPKLQTGKWVQGDPVKEFEKGKAYIVEFWATWCGPCRVSIPHLNEIYQKYKDKGLIVIGQDCWERDESKVAPFVKDMGEKMTYRVALDDKQDKQKGAMAETWMTAAGRNGIPSAFLVNQEGIVAWIGHPMQLEEKVIDQVLAGTFDVRKAAEAYELQEKKFAQLLTARMGINRATEQKTKNGKQESEDTISRLSRAVEQGDLERKQLAGLLRSRGHQRARMGHWKEAAADYSKAIELQPSNHLDYHFLAPLLVQSADLDGYRQHCARDLIHFAGTTDPIIAERVAKACLIWPGSGVDLRAADAFATTAVTVGTNHIYLPYFQFAKGLAEYRQGHFPEALDWMGKVLAQAEVPVLEAEANLVLAMSRFQLRQPDQARTALAKAVAIEEMKLAKLESGDIGVSWVDWIVAHVLLKEAQELIGKP